MIIEKSIIYSNEEDSNWSDIIKFVVDGSVCLSDGVDSLASQEVEDFFDLLHGIMIDFDFHSLEIVNDGS